MSLGCEMGLERTTHRILSCNFSKILADFHYLYSVSYQHLIKMYSFFSWNHYLCAVAR